MKTTHQTVAKILKLLSVAYPKQVDITSEMLNLWHQLLKDLDAEVVEAATIEVCAEPGQFPPPCGVIRDRAVKLSTGHLSLPTGIQAWERVQQWYREAPPAGATDEQKRAYYQLADKIELTDIERRALNSIGGSSVFQFSQNLMADRANFIRFFDAEVKSQFVEAAATQEAKALVGENRVDVERQLGPKPIGWNNGKLPEYMHRPALEFSDDNIPPAARQFLANLGITEPEEN